MKYILFSIAAAGVIPAAFFMVYDRRLLRITAFLIPLCALAFQQTAINFFSHELYRGTSRGMEVSLSYLCALVILLAILMRRGRLRLLPGAGSWLYCAYFLSCLVSTLNADSLLYSFFELWKMVMIYLVFLAVWNYLELTDDVELFWYAMGTVVLLNFPAVVWGYCSGVYQAHGVFPHQNSMSMYMSLAGNLFLARFFNCGGRFGRWFFAAAFGVASVSLVLTYSRGALACYPVGCALTVMLSLIYSFDRRKLTAAAAAGVAALLVFVVFLPRIVERFENAPEASGNTRLNFAVAAFNMMDDKLLGVGVNNWGIKINPPYTYSRHRDPALGYHEDYKDGIVETIYLLVGAECGYGGLAVLLGWFGYYWVLAARLLPRLAGTARFYVPAGVCGGLAAVYMQSVLEWVLKQQINFMQIMIVFAVVGYLNELRKRRNREALFRKKEETPAAA